MNNTKITIIEYADTHFGVYIKRGEKTFNYIYDFLIWYLDIIKQEYGKSINTDDKLVSQEINDAIDFWNNRIMHIPTRICGGIYITKKPS